MPYPVMLTFQVNQLSRIHIYQLNSTSYIPYIYGLGLQNFHTFKLNNILINTYNIEYNRAASWCKRLDARLPPLGSRVRVSVPPCGFRGGRNGVCVGFSRGFSCFPLQHFIPPFLHNLSSISFHFLSPCDGASGVVGRHPCYSRTYNLGASSQLSPRPDLVLDTS